LSGPNRYAGEMAEWLKAHAWKACLLERVTWVRIPLSPPHFTLEIPNAYAGSTKVLLTEGLLCATLCAMNTVSV
jgi:hypothetical protein